MLNQRARSQRLLAPRGSASRRPAPRAASVRNRQSGAATAAPRREPPRGLAAERSGFVPVVGPARPAAARLPGCCPSPFPAAPALSPCPVFLATKAAFSSPPAASTALSQPRRGAAAKGRSLEPPSTARTHPMAAAAALPSRRQRPARPLRPRPAAAPAPRPLRPRRSRAARRGGAANGGERSEDVPAPPTASAGNSCAPAPTAAQPPPTGPEREADGGQRGLCGFTARAPSRVRPGPAAAVRGTAFVSAAPWCRAGAPRARLQMRRSQQAARGKAASAATAGPSPSTGYRMARSAALRSR